MKCEECLEVIEEYFDGELDERASSDVRQHVMSCEACTRSLEALHDEQNLYVLYRRDVEVMPSLWTGIAAKIREEETPRDVPLWTRWRARLTELLGTPRLSPALTFALLILAVGATAALMKYMQSATAPPQPVARKQEQSAPAQPPKVSDTPVNTAPADEKKIVAVENDRERLAAQKEKSEEKPAPLVRVADKLESKPVIASRTGLPREASSDQLVLEAEQKYRAAIAMLARDAKRRRTLLEPDVRARFEQTLAAVDRTISETRRAARQQPDDPVAVQYMLAAYAKKVEVLREMATYRVDDRDIQ